MTEIQVYCKKLAKGGLQYEGLIRNIDYNEEQQLSTKVVKAKIILYERKENLDKHHAKEMEATSLAL